MLNVTFCQLRQNSVIFKILIINLLPVPAPQTAVILNGYYQVQHTEVMDSKYLNQLICWQFNTT